MSGDVIGENEDGATVAETEQWAKEMRVKLLARFMDFVESKVSSRVGGGKVVLEKSDNSSILLASYRRFNSQFLSSSSSSEISIHTLTQSYQSEDRIPVLSAYYKSFATLREVYGKEEVVVAGKSGLFRDAEEGKAEIYALFSGQGCNEVRLRNKSHCFFRLLPS